MSLKEEFVKIANLPDKIPSAHTHEEQNVKKRRTINIATMCF